MRVEDAQRIAEGLVEQMQAVDDIIKAEVHLGETSYIR
jgi:hypothetical protein